MRRSLFALAGWLVASAAWAQSAMPDNRGEATLACLSRPAPPQYPAQALEVRRSGFYRLELSFTAPDRRPDVRVLFESGSEALHDAALLYAEKFRLPCLPAGETVTALQEVRFSATDAGDVAAPAPQHLPTQPDARHLACLRSSQEPLRIGEASQLEGFKRELKNGNVIVKMTFTAPDQPPAVDVLYDTVNRKHRQNVLEHAAGYRVPCLEPGARLIIQQQFQLNFYGNAKFAFKDQPLVNFLGMTKNLEARPVNFDLSTMSCPFRVRFTLGQPALANGVAEVGRHDPNRVPLLKWMAGLELNVTREEFENLLGSEMMVDVPCGTIKLG